MNIYYVKSIKISFITLFIIINTYNYTILNLKKKIRNNININICFLENNKYADNFHKYCCSYFSYLFKNRSRGLIKNFSKKKSLNLLSL